MPDTYEITEQQFKEDKNLRETVQKLLADPKAGPMVEQALKLVMPNAATPRLDRQNQIQEPINAALKEVADLKAEMKKDKDEREKNEKLAAMGAKIEADKAKLRRDGWTEEGIKGVEKQMEDSGIIDVMDAAAIFEKKHPPQQPVMPSGTGAWNFMEGIGDGEGRGVAPGEGEGLGGCSTDRNPTAGSDGFMTLTYSRSVEL